MGVKKFKPECPRCSHWLDCKISDYGIHACKWLKNIDARINAAIFELEGVTEDIPRVKRALELLTGTNKEIKK